MSGARSPICSCGPVDGSIDSFKVPSTPQDPSIGVLDGLRAMAESRQLDAAEFARRTELIVHGTTVTTNAVLTRGGASTGLITTDGVRDALEMRRGIREEQYNNRCRNVVPLVPRSLRRTVRGASTFAVRRSLRCRRRTCARRRACWVTRAYPPWPSASCTPIPTRNTNVPRPRSCGRCCPRSISRFPPTCCRRFVFTTASQRRCSTPTSVRYSKDTCRA